MGSRGFWARAREDPHWTVVIEADGTVHAAGDLLARVNQISHGLLALGLRRGDGLAALVPNGVAPLEVYLAALQSGWYFTPINWHFTPPEIAYIVRDCEAKALFVAERFGDAGAAAADRRGCRSARFSYGAVPGFTPVETAVRPAGHRPARPYVPGPRCSTPRAPPAGPRACAAR